jgi:hypothetical protein
LTRKAEEASVSLGQRSRLGRGCEKLCVAVITGFVHFPASSRLSKLYKSTAPLVQLTCNLSFAATDYTSRQLTRKAEEASVSLGQRSRLGISRIESTRVWGDLFAGRLPQAK